MRKDIPWAEVRAAYRAGASCRELAEQYGVASTTLYEHRKRENWDAPVSTLDELTARLEALTTSLLAAPESDAVSVKDVKEMAALIKDLTALRRSKAEDGVIRVELSEDVAPWAE